MGGICSSSWCMARYLELHNYQEESAASSPWKGARHKSGFRDWFACWLFRLISLPSFSPIRATLPRQGSHGPHITFRCGFDMCSAQRATFHWSLELSHTWKLLCCWGWAHHVLSGKLQTSRSHHMDHPDSAMPEFVGSKPPAMMHACLSTAWKGSFRQAHILQEQTSAPCSHGWCHSFGQNSNLVSLQPCSSIEPASLVGSVLQGQRKSSQLFPPPPPPVKTDWEGWKEICFYACSS